jgi:hypothetical protein
MENQTLKNPDLKNEDVQTLMKSLTHEGYEGWLSVRERILNRKNCLGDC